MASRWCYARDLDLILVLATFSPARLCAVGGRRLTDSVRACLSPAPTNSSWTRMSFSWSIGLVSLPRLTFQLDVPIMYTARWSLGLGE